MINISDKQTRKELIDRYLDANTTAAEEKALLNYFLDNKDVDSDELAFAKLIRVEHADCHLLSHEDAEEYDRMVGKAIGNEQNKSFVKSFSWRWAASIGSIAACVALTFLLKTSPEEPDAMDMVQSLQQIVDLNLGEGTTVTATPVGESVWVEAVFADGTKKIFIMSQDKAMNTTNLMAIN